MSWRFMTHSELEQGQPQEHGAPKASLVNKLGLEQSPCSRCLTLVFLPSEYGTSSPENVSLSVFSANHRTCTFTLLLPSPLFITYKYRGRPSWLYRRGHIPPSPRFSLNMFLGLLVSCPPLSTLLAAQVIETIFSRT